VPNNIVIIDYQMGNLNSVKRKLSRLGNNAILTSSTSDIANADKIILPGVGHFQKAMQNLRSLGLLEALNEAVLVNQKPILGICLGMQLMAKHSEEGGVDGFGWFDANAVRFKVNDTLKFKVPHTGWNQITKSKESLLINGIPEWSEFYFVHSYHLQMNEPTDILNMTNYEYPFCSAIEKNNIFGVQYHPEKSHDVGEKLLKNFIQL